MGADALQIDREQALSAGAVPDTLAREINDISARHMQACMLPVQ